MQIEIRDITPEEAAPYGENADIVLTGRKTVVFTDADGNVGKLYMKEEDIDLLGKQYIAENSTLEYQPVRPHDAQLGKAEQVDEATRARWRVCCHGRHPSAGDAENNADG